MRRNNRFFAQPIKASIPASEETRVGRNVDARPLDAALVKELVSARA